MISLESGRSLVRHSLNLIVMDHITKAQRLRLAELWAIFYGQFQQCYYKHIIREANILAVSFSKHGLCVTYSCVFSVIPEFTVNFLLKDVNSLHEY